MLSHKNPLPVPITYFHNKLIPVSEPKSLQNHMKSRIISRNIKTLLYKTLIRPVLTYGEETWVLSKQDEHRLSIFERKILRKIYGPVTEGGRWRIRTNQELHQLCGENDIVKFCKLSRLRWAGHVIRQDDDDLSRRVLLSEPGGKRPRGRPRLRWEDGVKEDATKLWCRNWTVVALNREGWRKLWKEAEAYPGLQCRWRERSQKHDTAGIKAP